jgi:glycosyltransferase involved in cell wall biosynthesis
VLVTRTGGLQDIVRPHETGILVEPNHIDSLVWGILHTLQNPKWARARAQNALHDLEAIYSWHHAASETIRIYHSLLNDWQPEHMDVRLRQPGERVPVERQKQ